MSARTADSTLDAPAGLAETYAASYAASDAMASFESLETLIRAAALLANYRRVHECLMAAAPAVPGLADSLSNHCEAWRQPADAVIDPLGDPLHGLLEAAAGLVRPKP